MLITCHNCATSYEVEPSSLGPTGRSVRCARCGQVWFAANTSALAAIADGHRAEIAAFSATEPDGAPAAVAADGPIDDAPGLAPGLDVEAITPDFDPPAETPPGDAWGEPVTVADAPALAPDFTPDLATAPAMAVEAGAPVAALPLPEDIESVAARRAKDRARGSGHWAMPGIGTAILALLALNTGLVAWRADVVRALPQTASLYAAIGLPVNLRGVTFNDLTTTAETQDGVQVLMVEGTIVNTAKRLVEVPRLRFSVRNDKGGEVYTWTAQPPKSLLAPGETVSFRSRLASPPRDTHQVLVRFFNRRDLVAGVQ